VGKPSTLLEVSQYLEGLDADQSVFTHVTLPYPLSRHAETRLQHWLTLDQFHSCVVLAMGPGNQPPVRETTAQTCQFRSRPIQKPIPLPLWGFNLDLYLSTLGFCRVWLGPSVPIFTSAICNYVTGSMWECLGVAGPESQGGQIPE